MTSPLSLIMPLLLVKLPSSHYKDHTKLRAIDFWPQHHGPPVFWLHPTMLDNGICYLSHYVCQYPNNMPERLLKLMQLGLQSTHVTITSVVQ